VIARKLTEDVCRHITCHSLKVIQQNVSVSFNLEDKNPQFYEISERIFLLKCMSPCKLAQEKPNICQCVPHISSFRSFISRLDVCPCSWICRVNGMLDSDMLMLLPKETVIRPPFD
jgi:hypothetical protein